MSWKDEPISGAQVNLIWRQLGNVYRYYAPKSEESEALLAALRKKTKGEADDIIHYCRMLYDTHGRMTDEKFKELIGDV